MVDIKDFFDTQEQRDRWDLNNEILKVFPASLDMDELRKHYSIDILRDAPMINFMGIKTEDSIHNINASALIPCPFTRNHSISETHLIYFNPKTRKKWTMVLLRSQSTAIFDRIKDFHPLYELLNKKDFDFIIENKEILKSKYLNRYFHAYIDGISDQVKNSPHLNNCYIKRLI